MTAVSQEGVATYDALKDIRPHNTGQLRTITAVNAYTGTTRNSSEDERGNTLGVHNTPVLEGVGTLHSRLGYTFSGNLHDGQPCGHGVLRWSDGRVVVGVFEKGVVDGTGTLQWPNGDTYTGALRKSVRHGSGCFTEDSGQSCYEGEWRDGMRHGSGEQRYANGSVYRGSWANNTRHGRGTLRYASGDVYEGEWEDDVPSGSGVMGWVDATQLFYKEVYTGQWRKGRPAGAGQSTYVSASRRSAATPAAAAVGSPPPPPSPSQPLPDPSLFMAPADALLNVYVGAYRDGQRDGLGVFYYADGSCYQGRWSAGVKCGPGSFTSAVGEVREEPPTHQPTTPAEAADAAAGGESATSLAVVPTVSPAGLGSLLESEDDLRLTLHNLLHRYNTTLKNLFQQCCQLHTDVALPSTPHNWWQQRLPGRVALVQCLALLHRGGVLGADFTVGDALRTAADVVRIEITLLEASVSVDTPTSLLHAPAAAAAAPAAASLSVTAAAISCAEGALTYRQFCEWLVRVAVRVVTGPAALTVAAKLRALLEGPLSTSASSTAAAATRVAAGSAVPSVAAVFLPRSLRHAPDVQQHLPLLMRCYKELQSVTAKHHSMHRGDEQMVSLRLCLTAVRRTLQRHHVTPARVVEALAWLKNDTSAHTIDEEATAAASTAPHESLAHELRMSAMAKNRAVQQADENTAAAQTFVEFAETVMTMADVVQSADGTSLEMFLAEMQCGLFAE